MRWLITITPGPESKNFMRINLKKVKDIQEKVRLSQVELEHQKQQQPVKAIHFAQKYEDVKPKVTAFMKVCKLVGWLVWQSVFEVILPSFVQPTPRRSQSVECLVVDKIDGQGERDADKRPSSARREGPSTPQTPRKVINIILTCMSFICHVTVM